MPFPRASQALSRFTVLDLTRVRSGPTCVRQLADWGANVIKIETPPHLEKGEGPGGRAPGAGLPEPAPQQAQHHPRPEIAAGAGRLQAPGREGRRGGRELPPRREGPPRHRLRAAEEDQQTHRARQHFRLRPGRALSRPARLRPDRARHGRADVDHRLAGAGPGARRHSDRRSHRRPVLRHRHSHRAARARRLGRGPVGFDLAAAGADLHARLPGRALAAGAGGAQAGRQQPPDQHSRPACSRPRTATSTSPPAAR